jgi:GDPmannose 4,6-dehydratase
MDAKRDWGYAKDYTYGMWRSLQAPEPDTFVFATNQMHTVREFVTLAGTAAGLNVRWEGSAENEVGIDDNSGRTVVRVNPDFYRPMEINLRVGNAEKAWQQLGWKPSTPLRQLCEMMVEADIRRIRR